MIKEKSAYEGRITRAKSRAGANAPNPPDAVPESSAGRQRGRSSTRRSTLAAASKSEVNSTNISPSKNGQPAVTTARVPVESSAKSQKKEALGRAASKNPVGPSTYGILTRSKGRPSIDPQVKKAQESTDAATSGGNSNKDDSCAGTTTPKRRVGRSKTVEVARRRSAASKAPAKEAAKIADGITSQDSNDARAVGVIQKSVEGRSRTVETRRRRSAASKPPVKGVNRIADEANAQYSNVEGPRAVETTKKSGGRPKTVEPRRSSARSRAPAKGVAAHDANKPIVREGAWTRSRSCASARTQMDASESRRRSKSPVDSPAVKIRQESRGRAPSRKTKKPKIIEVIEVSSREVTPEPLGPATNRHIALRAENKRAKSRRRTLPDDFVVGTIAAHWALSYPPRRNQEVAVEEKKNSDGSEEIRNRQPYRRPVFPPKRLAVPSEYNEIILEVKKSRIDGNGVNVLPTILPNSTQLAPSSTEEDSNSHDVKDEEPVAKTVDCQNGKEDEIRNTAKEKEGSHKGEEETNDGDSAFNNPKSQSDPEDVIPLSPTEQAQRNQNTEEKKKVDEEGNSVQNLRQMENHHDKAPRDPIHRQSSALPSSGVSSATLPVNQAPEKKEEKIKAKANSRSEEEREKEMIRLGIFLSDSEEEVEEPVKVEEEANGQGGDQENNRLSPTEAAPQKAEWKEDVQESQSKRRRA